jgi:hypothetical protein
MGLILYRCSDEFPDRIPVILADMSPKVSCEFGPHIATSDASGFSYIVTRGKARIMIYGGPEEGFMSVMIVDGSRSFLRSLIGGRARVDLAADVKSALLKAGIKQVTVEEMEEFDAQQRQKEAEEEVRNQ